MKGGAASFPDFRIVGLRPIHRGLAYATDNYSMHFCIRCLPKSSEEFLGAFRRLSIDITVILEGFRNEALLFHEKDQDP